MRPLLDGRTRDAHQSRNQIHSVLLIAGIGCVAALAAGLIWGWPGVIMAFVSIALLSALAPRLPADAVMRLYRAKRIDPASGNQLTEIVRSLSQRAELLRQPDLFVIPSGMLNAFATGSPERSAIAVTEGLLRRLEMREIAGVLGHEISHIRNNDLWVMGLADLMTRYVQVLSYTALALAVLNVFGMLAGDELISWWAILLLYFAPAISSLLQLGLSRAREYDADLEGARLTGDPEGLASALMRLERYTGQFWEDFTFPVPGRRVPQPSLLRSHPPTDLRVARLRELEGSGQVTPPIIIPDAPMVSLIGVGPIQMRPRHRFPGVWY